eukprot:3865643-Rhodomonas_salina.1
MWIAVWNWNSWQVHGRVAASGRAGGGGADAPVRRRPAARRGSVSLLLGQDPRGAFRSESMWSRFVPIGVRCKNPQSPRSLA